MRTNNPSLMRPRLLIANWKMHKTLAEGVQDMAALSEVLHQHPAYAKGVQVILLPSFVHVATLAARQDHWVQVGAQNCHDQPQGAFTGEVSAAMIASTGAQWVLVGHSERRTHGHESDDQIRKKTDAVLACGLRPIVCCGEDQDTRKQGQTISFLLGQLQRTLGHLSPEQVAQSVIAYEPLWAIGAATEPEPSQVQHVHHHLRQAMAEQYGEQVAHQIPIVYGGNGHEGNVAALLAEEDVDGCLIGRASLDVQRWCSIIREASHNQSKTHETRY